MITKGVTQEQKPSILCNINMDTTFTNETANTIYKKLMDFSKIDYIFYDIIAILGGGGGGNGHIKIFVGATEKVDFDIDDNVEEQLNGLIDCTAINTSLALSVTVIKTDDSLIVNNLYMSVVDT